MAFCFDVFPPDRLQADEPVTTVPTIGFNVETVQYKNIKFQVWDLGGQVCELCKAALSSSSDTAVLPPRANHNAIVHYTTHSALMHL